MAWASRMATMAALLTATSGVVLVLEPEANGGCCILRDAAKLTIKKLVQKLDPPSSSCPVNYVFGFWMEDPKTCEAVKKNGKTYLELHKCVWTYWKDTQEKPETKKAKIDKAKIAVVFSGIRVIPKAPDLPLAADDPDYCKELFTQILGAAQAELPFTEEEKHNNDVAKAAYDKLLKEVDDAEYKGLPILINDSTVKQETPTIETNPNATVTKEKAPENDPKTDNFQDVQTIVKAPIVDNPNDGSTAEDDKAAKETPIVNSNRDTNDKATTDKSETNSDLDNKANNVDSSKVDTKTGTIAKEVPQNANTEIVTMKDEVEQTGTSQNTGSGANNVVVKEPEVKATIVPPKNTDSSDNTGGGKTPEVEQTGTSQNTGSGANNVVVKEPEAPIVDKPNVDSNAKNDKVEQITGSSDNKGVGVTATTGTSQNTGSSDNKVVVKEPEAGGVCRRITAWFKGMFGSKATSARASRNHRMKKWFKKMVRRMS